MTYDRNQMIEQLRERVCRVIFTKINGEERDMQCTLNMEMIPEEKQPKTGKEYNDTVLRVFDINQQEFRSFRVENVISFS
jgi:hypothetical protein